MKIFLTDQKKYLHHHLLHLMKMPVMAYDVSAIAHKVSSLPIKGMVAIGDLDLTFLFDYNIFPTHIMSFLTQWDFEKREMRIGDTIAQQVYLPPTPFFSQKLIFGVRIKDIFNEPGKRGFSYETLEGHAEKGISYFTVENAETGPVFKIETYSEPSNFVSKLMGPIFSNPYQAYCTKKAMQNVKGKLESTANS